MHNNKNQLFKTIKLLTAVSVYLSEHPDLRTVVYGICNCYIKANIFYPIYIFYEQLVECLVLDHVFRHKLAILPQADFSSLVNRGESENSELCVVQISY